MVKVCVWAVGIFNTGECALALLAYLHGCKCLRSVAAGHLCSACRGVALLMRRMAGRRSDPPLNRGRERRRGLGRRRARRRASCRGGDLLWLWRSAAAGGSVVWVKRMEIFDLTKASRSVLLPSLGLKDFIREPKYDPTRRVM